MKLAIVEWEDACDIDTEPWVDAHEDFKYTPLIATQVGYIVYEGKEGIVMSAAKIGGSIARRSQIPKGMIRSIKILKETDE
tara:strand:- start:450 stop:692 length:243 start_codon:yes stop_codon:yes gene_type:complete